MTTSKTSRKRMAPEQRYEQLLGDAMDYVTTHGTEFSLDEIAAVAGISPPLMRHYFRNRDGLLVALCERIAASVLRIFSAPDGGDFGQRLASYLDLIADHHWGHRLRSEERRVGKEWGCQCAVCES